MATYKLVDFSDIINAVMEQLKLQTSDTVSRNRIKRDINMYYLHEVVPFTKWPWLVGHTSLVHRAYYNAGTAAITPDTTTVVLSTVIPSGLGSKAGFNFSIEGQDEIYKIASHTAGSATFELSSAYQGSLVTVAKFKIWSDKINLPSDCRETTEVYTELRRQPLEGRGLQEFRRIVAQGPKSEGIAFFYSTNEYEDPTPLDAESDTDRYRIMRIYPSVNTTNYTVHIDYQREAEPLEDDGDEPIIPVNDRIILVYGALERAWTRERNPEEAANNRAKAMDKLARMAGRVDDSIDKPVISPDSVYITTKRGPRIAGVARRLFNQAVVGGTNAYPTYAKDITIEGGNFTANMTANSGVTIDGRDISVDGANLDAHILATAAHGTVGNIVGTSDTQVLTNKTIDIALNDITGSPASNEIAIFGSTGLLEASGVTIGSLGFLDDVEGLTSVTLNDNQVAAATILTYPAASFSAVWCMFSIKRGTDVEMGVCKFLTDGSSTDKSEDTVLLGSHGVTLTSDLSGGNLRLRYTSTSTGTAPVFKFRLFKWLM